MFERAVALAGRQPELLGQWAQALYFAGNKAWTPQIQGLADEALKADPKEVTSLGLMGINAFESQHYQAAVDYWKRLLAVLPPKDPSRSALEGGIARASDKLVQSGGKLYDEPALAAQGAHLNVHVTLSDALKGKVQPSDTVFVFARAVSGPPAPLAVKRVTVADLPVDVELTDADAMMPQLKLSNFAQVQLVARVSRAGQPTAGEWIGRSQPLPSNVTARQALTIDSPDQ
jgi:cytochrome c-type biogenesis protein CcmH